MSIRFKPQDPRFQESKTTSFKNGDDPFPSGFLLSPCLNFQPCCLPGSCVSDLEPSPEARLRLTSARTRHRSRSIVHPSRQSRTRVASASCHSTGRSSTRNFKPAAKARTSTSNEKPSSCWRAKICVGRPGSERLEATLRIGPRAGQHPSADELAENRAQVPANRPLRSADVAVGVAAVADDHVHLGVGVEVGEKTTDFLESACSGRRP